MFKKWFPIAMLVVIVIAVGFGIKVYTDNKTTEYSISKIEGVDPIPVQDERPFGTVPEKAPAWNDLGQWEIDISTVPNLDLQSEDMSWVQLHTMLGAVIIAENWQDLNISVDMDTDASRSDNDPNVWVIQLHGDVNYTVSINMENYTYLIS